MLKRKTIISSEVLDILEKNKHPMSIIQIIKTLQYKGLTPNKTTIYRIIEKLIQQKTITEISVKNSASHYELSDHHHHHHFICNECTTVYCLKQCHVESHQINLDHLLPNPNFSIDSHDFNLYGTCEPCQKKLGEKK